MSIVVEVLILIRVRYKIVRSTRVLADHNGPSKNEIRKNP